MSAAELYCLICTRSTVDGKPDDELGDRCPFCGQLPADEGDE